NFSSNPGIRSISVIATNSCGSSSATVYNVDVSNPVAAFSPNPASGTLNNPVAFSTTTPGVSSIWTFQNGNPFNSTSQNPTVVWTSAGTFPLSLVVVDSEGCLDTLSSQVTISSCTPVSMNFTSCGAAGRYGPLQA